MNWLEGIGIGYAAGVVTVLFACGYAALYVKAHPEFLVRRMMKMGNKKRGRNSDRHAA